MLSKQEIRQLGNREMMEELQRSRRELLKAQFDVRNGISKEVHMVKNLRRYVALLQTIAKEMNMEVKPAMSKAEAAPAAAEEKKTAPEAKKPAPKKTTAAKKAKAPAKKPAKTAKK